MITANRVKAPRKLKFVPKGTPWQQSCWMRGIERALKVKAADLRREAARADRIAAKIEAQRLTGKPLSDNLLLCKVVNAYAGWNCVAKLAGITQYRDRLDLVRKVQAVTDPPILKLKGALSEAISIARDHKKHLAEGGK